MTEPRVTPKTCGNCAHFQRRSPDEPWPVAGVSREADGRCGVPTIEKIRFWRAETDWCDQHKKVRKA